MAIKVIQTVPEKGLSSGSSVIGSTVMLRRDEDEVVSGGTFLRAGTVLTEGVTAGDEGVNDFGFMRAMKNDPPTLADAIYVNGWAIGQNNRIMIINGGTTIYYTDDLGETVWQSIGGLPQSTKFIATDGNGTWVGTRDLANSVSLIYSTDNGDTWQTGQIINSIADHCTGIWLKANGNVYVQTKSDSSSQEGRVMFASSVTGSFSSKGNFYGSNTNQAMLGFRPHTEDENKCVSHGNGQTVGSDYGYRMYRTIDGGTTWTNRSVSRSAITHSSDELLSSFFVGDWEVHLTISGDTDDGAIADGANVKCCRYPTIGNTSLDEHHSVNIPDTVFQVNGYSQYYGLSSDAVTHEVVNVGDAAYLSNGYATKDGVNYWRFTESTANTFKQGPDKSFFIGMSTEDTQDNRRMTISTPCLGSASGHSEGQANQYVRIS